MTAGVETSALERRHEYYKLVCVGVKDVRMRECVRVNLVLASAMEAPPPNQHAVSFVCCRTDFAVSRLSDF